MKLFRHGPKGAEKPGLIDAQGVARDLTGVVPDIAAHTLSPAGLASLAALDVTQLPRVPDGERWGACVGGVGNVIAIGLNYADHAAEAGLKAPGQPIVFSKHTGSVSGPNDDVWLPPGEVQLDWEVELGVVIGQVTWHVAREQALSHVAGYCLLNDVSERVAQIQREGQWIKGKSYPTHCPIGPWLLTADEVADPQQIDLWLEVNGVRRQTGNTRNMIFDVATLVSYVSQFMALQPGDVIATGTPAGVGMGFKPPVFLQAGDVVTLGSPLLGGQTQRVVNSPC